MDIIQEWQTLSRTALLGTARAGSSPVLAGPEWEELLPCLQVVPNSGDEISLLRLAGVLGLVLDAGHLASTGLKELEALPLAPSEEGVPLPMEVMEHCALLVNEAEELVPEWFRLAHGTGRCIPFPLLPGILEAGARSSQNRDHLIPLLGTRGQWLAQFETRWSYAAKATLEPLGLEEYTETAEEQEVVAGVAWPTSMADRVPLLTALRDSDPATSRAILEQIWPGLSASDRAKLLECFAVGLEPADAPLLQVALTGPHKRARSIAAQLLLRLPESSLQAKLAELAAECVVLTQVGNQLHMEVRLPESYQKDWEVLGIEEKLPDHLKEVGPRAWWLYQILGRLHPVHWGADRYSPDELFAVVPEEWQDLWLDAMEDAAASHRHTDWSTWLFKRFWKKTRVAWRLASIARPEALWELATTYLCHSEETAEENGRSLCHLLKHLPAPWPTTFEEKCWKVALPLAAQATEPHQPWVAVLRQFILQSSPGEVLNSWESISGYPLPTDQPRALQQLVPLLSHRIKLHKLFEGL